MTKCCCCVSAQVGHRCCVTRVGVPSTELLHPSPTKGAENSFSDRSAARTAAAENLISNFPWGMDDGLLLTESSRDMYRAHINTEDRPASRYIDSKIKINCEDQLRE